MVTVKASMTWPGPQTDVLKLFVEPTPDDWGTEVYDGDLVLFRALDRQGEPAGEVVGLEIVGFLDFDRWEDLPRLDLLWQLPGQEPLPLKDLLQREQRRLRAQARQVA
jgi:hypothetical protein